METNFVELKRNVLPGACEIPAQWEVVNEYMAHQDYSRNFKQYFEDGSGYNSTKFLKINTLGHFVWA